MVLLPALNQMIDITTTRLMAARNHPPRVVYVMLAGFILAGAFLAGYAMARGRSRSWTHVLVFAAVMTATFYVILDIEYPRLGLIRVDDADEVLVDLRRQME